MQQFANILKFFIFRFKITWKLDCSEDRFLSKIHYHIQNNKDSILSGKALSGDIDEYRKTITNIDLRGCMSSKGYSANVTLRFNGENPVVVEMEINETILLVGVAILSLLIPSFNEFTLRFVLLGFAFSYFFTNLWFYYEVLTKWSAIHDMLRSGGIQVTRMKYKEKMIISNENIQKSI